MKLSQSQIKELSAALHSEAYTIQQGEFWPETHLANVRHLQGKYSAISPSTVDEVYRQACLIDYVAKEQVGTSHLSDAAKLELLDWLEDQFHGFDPACLREAIERATPC